MFDRTANVYPRFSPPVPGRSPAIDTNRRRFGALLAGLAIAALALPAGAVAQDPDLGDVPPPAESDPACFGYTPPTFSAARGERFSGAVFSSRNATVVAGCIDPTLDNCRVTSADVRWGDGSASPAESIVHETGFLEISAGHTYATDGEFLGAVDIKIRCVNNQGEPYTGRFVGRPGGAHGFKVRVGEGASPAPSPGTADPPPAPAATPGTAGSGGANPPIRQRAAGARGVRTPGYKGTRKAPATRSSTPSNPFVAGDGIAPASFVDAGGTAHIVWDGRTRRALNYCRVRRGGTRCDATERTFPQSEAPGADPRVVAYGDTLVLLTQRSAGGEAAGVVTAYVSEDGGTSFQPPVTIGGETRDLPGRGQRLRGAATYGPPGNERIGLVYAGGYVESVAPGVEPRGLTDLLPDVDDAQVGGGTIAATPGGGLVAAFDVGIRAASELGIRGNGALLTWNRTGDAADAAQWSRAPIAGHHPTLAGGSAGAALQTFRPRSGELQVQRIGDDGALGPPVVLNTRDDERGDPGPPVIDAAGAVRAVLTTRDVRDGRIDAVVSRVVRRGATTAGPPTTLLEVAAPGTLGFPSVAALADGGFVIARRNSVTAEGRRGDILVEAFGSSGPTGQPSLGGLPGSVGNTDPRVLERCARVEYSAIDVVATGGCLLNAIGRPGYRVSEGTIKLNGLEIVPDRGVKILLNSRERTIDTTGAVTVQLRLDANTVIPLLREELHLKLPSEPDRTQAAPGCTGTKLLGFDADLSKPFLQGFPIRGQVAVFLGEDSACIPVALGLPKAFGGIRGNAVLRVTNEDGLKLDSMRIAVKGVYLGPLLVEELDIRCQNAGNVWSATAKIGLPPQPGGAKLGGSLTFVDGSFERVLLSLDPPFPGIPLFGPTYLASIGGGFSLEPFTLEASARVGAIPLTGRVYTVAVDGRLVITFGDPVVFDFTGQGSLLGYGVAEARVTLTTDGFFRARGSVNIDLSVASARGSVGVFVDLPSERFSGRVTGDVCVAGFICLGADAVVSSIGTGACLDLPVGEVGFGYRWGASVFDVAIMVPDCDISGYDVELPAGVPRARAAQAGGPTFTVPAGARIASIKLTGSGGPPNVALVSPGGERIVPATEPNTPGATAFAIAQPPTASTYVGVVKPAPGTWTVEPLEGSAPIASLRQARPLPRPQASARLGGRGRLRTLTYDVTTGNGLSTSFVERDARGGSRVIGRATRGKGTLRFTTGDGPRGARTVTALIARNGVPRSEKRLGTYAAPAPQRPGRPGRVRVTRSRGGLLVRWTGAPRAAGYAVTARLSDGRTPLTPVGPRTRRVRIRAVPRSLSARVTVVARDRRGRAGRAARARTSRRR